MQTGLRAFARFFKNEDNMSTQNIFRFIIIGVLWLLLVVWILSHAVINFFTLFAIAASGIIVFVPLWKKYGPGK